MSAAFAGAALYWAAGLAIPAGPAEADTLETVRDRGILRCGVINSGIGVSEIDETGRWQGFFPEFCRALAAAVLGNADAVEYVEVNYIMRFDALNSDGFDVLMANTTWTASRDAELNLAFTHPLYYDGQGFLAHASLGARSVADLAEAEGATICVNEGTTTIGNLRELITRLDLPLEVMAFQSIEGVYGSFFSRECDLMTQDRVALVSQRLNRAPDPEAIILFPDVISKEPLGPAVREDDQQWFDIVQWTAYATMIAEEHGIRSATVDDYLDSALPEVRRLLGQEPGIGAILGLDAQWAYRAIKQVGAYDEIYARTLGEQSSLQLARGLNALWVDGGLLYAPPLR
jgi:general L-amino acid transport system substrate-binding protein